MDYEEDHEVSSQERLDRQLNAAAERLAQERPYIAHDDLGQCWLVPLDLIQDCYTYERAIYLAESAGEDAGFCWAMDSAKISDLEKLAASSVDMSTNEIDPAMMLDYMEQREVPPNFAPSFLRGFIRGCLTLWEVVKPRVLERLLNSAP